MAGSGGTYGQIKWSQEGEKAVYGACFVGYWLGIVADTVVAVVGLRAWCGTREEVDWRVLEVQSIIMVVGIGVGFMCCVPPLGHYLAITIEASSDISLGQLIATNIIHSFILVCLIVNFINLFTMKLAVD